MSTPRAFITGLGLVTAAGLDPSQVLESLRTGRSGLGPLKLFPTSLPQPPIVGELPGLEEGHGRPRTQVMAWMAAKQALAHDPGPPEALVLGVATGGVLSLEEVLLSGRQDHELFRDGAITVGEMLARETQCQGPVLSVSTACSSGAAALKVALELIRSGTARRVLCLGVETLSRLTVYGFHFLQLLDPRGTRPLDRHRGGMSLGEAAAALLLTAGSQAPPQALAELRGGGLTCDAYHPIAPHPEGLGAAAAMEAALSDAGLTPSDVDYINLHGTGTEDNDASEAAAVHRVFGAHPPLLSSTKGLFGHTTAAAGTVEAAVGVLAIVHGLVPANTGLVEVDPRLDLTPVAQPRPQRVRVVLSNSFGFGGNNAALVLGNAGLSWQPPPRGGLSELAVYGAACLTGAGGVPETLERFLNGNLAAGVSSDLLIGADLPPRTLRRLKRLPRLALALGQGAAAQAGSPGPQAVFFGTGYGTLSETHSFLKQLFESGEQFSSPVDFMGSVHNAPAGHVALLLKATGANLTTWGGHHTFEQALFLAALLTSENQGPALVIGADEAHEFLTPLVDQAGFERNGGLADGGGALQLGPAADRPDLPTIRPVFLAPAGQPGPAMADLLARLGGPAGINSRLAAVLVGLPALARDQATTQLNLFMSQSGFDGPVIDYRHYLGDFATAAAVAAVMAVKLAETGLVPATLAGRDVTLDGRGLLLLSLGETAAALEIRPPRKT
jgi:3-oxoacyl-(acyl-carrier-protein) synthase